VAHEILVRLTRGNQVESVHYGSYCVVKDGKILRGRGDQEFPVFYRSAAKPIQAIAVVESGAPERFGFTDQELAMVMGSHSGSRFHAATAATMLEKIGEDPSILRCGGHRPLARSVYEGYIREDFCWGRLEDNCSGKHSGMIGAAKAWGEDCSSYAEPTHRVQRENLANVALLTGVAERDIGVGTDGCAVPCFAVPLPAMARAAARFTTPDDLPESKAAAARRILDTATKHPEMVAGDTRFDTKMMRAGAGRVLSKEGAEGVQILGVRGENMGIAIKVADGAHRAQEAIAASLLLDLGILARDDIAEYLSRDVLNREGESVGQLEVTL